MSDTMSTTTSADGSTIAWYPGTARPPLLCVGGALSDHSMWAGLAAHLPGAEPHVLERRGRGASTDRPGSGPGDEIADVHAVLREIAAPTVLVGHSSGALLALRAAAANPLVCGVVAYEPPPPPPVDGTGERLRELLAADDRAGAVRCFMLDAVGVPEQVVRARLAADGHQADLALAHTLPHEIALAEDGVPADVTDRLAAPVVLLLGSASPRSMADNVNAIARRLRRAEVRTLDGQAHFALAAAPQLVAAHVRDAMRTS